MLRFLALLLSLTLFAVTGNAADYASVDDAKAMAIKAADYLAPMGRKRPSPPSRPRMGRGTIATSTSPSRTPRGSWGIAWHQSRLDR